jgi:hypothetical protein
VWSLCLFLIIGGATAEPAHEAAWLAEGVGRQKRPCRARLPPKWTPSHPPQDHVIIVFDHWIDHDKAQRGGPKMSPGFDE